MRPTARMVTTAIPSASAARTALLLEAQEDIDELGEGSPPQAETGGPSLEQPEATGASVQQWIMILAVAVGVILVVGFAVFAGMRRR